MVEFLLSLDRYLFLFLNTQFSNPILDFFFVTITEARFWIIPAFLGAAFFIGFQKKKALIVIGLALITVALTDPISARIIKPLAGRLRPCHPDVLLEGGNFLLGLKKSFSFPSSHSMNIFAQATLLSLFYPRKSIWFFIFASIIGFSRIYVGVHYPGDVIFGALFGIIIACGVFYSFRFVLLLKGRRRSGLPEENSLPEK
ncbi:MAG: phosphatase PAP2 family protein [Fibrobacter sp.]|nr:phosphatase PAP2 family protein [Fibrobacter sp.]